jgi:hypothetical protein
MNNNSNIFNSCGSFCFVFVFGEIINIRNLNPINTKFLNHKISEYTKN